MLTAKQEAFCLAYLTEPDASKAGCKSLGLPEDGWYVYFLIDPRNSQIFYVGKGRGDRMASHARNACNSAGRQNGGKSARILEIQAAGAAVREVVFATFGTSDDAYACERELIRRLRESGLTNVANGCVTGRDRIISEARRLLAICSLAPAYAWIRVELEKQIADPCPRGFEMVGGKWQPLWT